MSIPIFGLQNDASVCYFNSLLQCILSLSDLSEEILQYDKEKLLKRKKLYSYYYFRFIEEILKNHSLIKKNKYVFNPVELKRHFLQMSPFSTSGIGHQQDADEFLISFFDNIHEELKSKMKLHPRLIGVGKEHKNFNEYLSIYKNEYSPIMRLFNIQETIKMLCDSCKSVKTRYELQLRISVDIPSIRCSLNDCLSSVYRRPELLEGYKCDSCSEVSTTYKMTTLSIIPKYLIITLKRFSSMRGLRSTIEVPEKLNLDKYIYEVHHNILKMLDENKYQSLDYKLIGGVFHIGNMNGGHYISVVKRGNNWIKCNDEDVDAMERKPDFSKAYILFYKRKKYNKEIEVII